MREQLELREGRPVALGVEGHQRRAEQERVRPQEEVDKNTLLPLLAPAPPPDVVLGVRLADPPPQLARQRASSTLTPKRPRNARKVTSSKPGIPNASA